MTSQTDTQLIFECDYGKRTPVKDILIALMRDFDIDTLTGVALFVNNIPLKLEFFIVLTFEKAIDLRKVTEPFESVGVKQRSDLTLADLVKEMSNKRFDMCSIIDEQTCEFFFENMFEYGEKDDWEKSGFVIQPLGGKPEVFVSCSGNDSGVVEKVVGVLNAKGISIWYFKHSIEDGDNLVLKIESGIRPARGCIFWITNSFLKSNWCKHEMSVFLNKFVLTGKIFLIPVKTKEVAIENMPELLKSIRFISEEDFPTIEGLAGRIASSVEKKLNRSNR